MTTPWAEHGEKMLGLENLYHQTRSYQVIKTSDLEPVVIANLEEVLDYGGGKHGPGAWRDRGVMYYLQKLHNHIVARESGELHDKETKKLHSVHMAANALFMASCESVK